MKQLTLIGCLLVSILAGIGIEAEKAQYARAWSWADPLIPFLAALVIWQLSVGQWRLNRTALILALNVAVLGLAGIANATANGTLLNFGRNATVAFLVYVATFNTVRNQRDLKLYSGLVMLAAVGVYVLSIPNLIAAWSGGFTNLFYVFGFIDLNALGFIFVLLFCSSAPRWLNSVKFTQGVAFGGALAVGALVSFSRSAWTTLAASALLITTLRDSRGVKDRVFRFVTLAAAFVVAGLIFNWVAQQLPGAAQFGQNKVDDYGDDAIGLRWIELTVKPVQEWLDQSLLVVLFGDGVTFQHTFVANAVWMSGFFGLVSGIAVYVSMGLTALKATRFHANREVQLAGACYLAMVVAMFLDDSVTNQKFHSQLISYLFAGSAGAFSGSFRVPTMRVVPVDPAAEVSRKQMARRGQSPSLSLTPEPGA